MGRVLTVRGRVINPQTVVLDEPLPEGTRQVDVVARIESGTARLSAILEALPPGTRSKQDMDAQVAEERGSWER